MRSSGSAGAAQRLRRRSSEAPQAQLRGSVGAAPTRVEAGRGCVGDLPQGDIQLFSGSKYLGVIHTPNILKKRAKKLAGLAAEHTGLHGALTRAYREKKLAMPVCLRPREASRAASLAAAL